MFDKIVQIVSTLLIAVEVYFVYRQTKIVAQQLKDGNDWNRIQATISVIDKYAEVINQIDNSILEKIKLISLQPHDVSVKDMDSFMSDASNRKTLFLLCDFFEELAIGIKFGYLNEELAFEQLYTPVVYNFDNLHVYVQIRRAETKVNICGNFEWLATRWKKKANA